MPKYSLAQHVSECTAAWNKQTETNTKVSNSLDEIKGTLNKAAEARAVQSRNVRKALLWLIGTIITTGLTTGGAIVVANWQVHKQMETETVRRVTAVTAK